MGRLAGKRAIITGAGRGIGKAISAKFLEEGARIVVCDLVTDRLEQAVGDLRARGEVHGLNGDVTDRAFCERLVAEAGLWLGGVDVLVNNAGIAVAQPFLEHEPAAWDRTLAVNLTAPFVLGQLAARAMVAQGTGGAIVNMASTNGHVGERGLAAYNASKAGVVLLTKTMAIELAEHKIRVNCVAPGWIATELHEEVQLDPALAASYMEKIPLRRAGRPEEVANVFAFLASDEAGFVTGESVVVTAANSPRSEGDSSPSSPSLGRWLNVPALTAVVIWSGTFPIAKYALEEFHVLSYAAIRPLVAAAIGVALLKGRGEGMSIAREDWPRLLLAGFGGMAAFQICFIVGLERTSASHSALIASAAPPILGAVVLWLLKGERPVGRTVLGLALGFVGVALLVGDPSAAGASLAGDLISTAAALAWVAVTVVPAPLVRRYGAIRVSTWLILCTGVALLPFSLGALRETARDVPSLLAWGSLFYTAVLGMVTANTLWQRAVQNLGANQTIPYLYLQPLLALTLSAALLGERLGPLQLAGGLAAMVGVALVRRRPGSP